MALKDISNNTVTNSIRYHSLSAHTVRYFSVYFLFPSPNQQCSFYYLYFTDRDDRARKLWKGDCIQVPLIPKAISEKFIIRDSAQLCPSKEYNLVSTTLVSINQSGKDKYCNTNFIVAGLGQKLNQPRNIFPPNVLNL